MVISTAFIRISLSVRGKAKKWQKYSKGNHSGEKGGVLRMVEFRSKFEREIAEQIGRRYKTPLDEYYEKVRLRYPDTKEGTRTRLYIPDFVLPNGIVIEAKGYFRLENKKKYRQVKKWFPELDLRIVFQEPTGIKAGENGAWCRKYRIPFASCRIPEAWFTDMGKRTQRERDSGNRPESQRDSGNRGQKNPPVTLSRKPSSTNLSR
jgi:hypothetical protein